MHLALGRKARFIAPILTTFKMNNFSNVIRAKELSFVKTSPNLINFLQGHEDIYHRPNKKVNCETKILHAENLNLSDDASRFSVIWHNFEYLWEESHFTEKTFLTNVWN